MLMNNTSRWLVGLSVIVTLCLANQLTGQMVEGDSANGKIAFIDLPKVLRNHQQIIQMQRDFNVLKNKIEGEIDLELKEIEKLREEMMVYTSNSDEYLGKMDEIERKELGINQKKRTIVIKHNNNLIEQLKDSYKAIDKAVKGYVAQRGIKTVFTYDYEIDLARFETPEDVLDWVTKVDILCHDEERDITDAIIKIVNKE